MSETEFSVLQHFNFTVALALWLSNWKNFVEKKKTKLRISKLERKLKRGNILTKIMKEPRHLQLRPTFVLPKPLSVDRNGRTLVTR